jgi:hypothetical protein
VYAPIVGIPPDLAPPSGLSPDYDALVSPDPWVRDDRMEERVDPAMPRQLVPSCNVPGVGTAYPPVRIVQVAQGLELAGANVTVQSICSTSYDPITGETRADYGSAIEEIIRRIYRGLDGSL